MYGRDNRRADDRVLADRCVQDAPRKFLGKPLRRFKCAAEGAAHVLSVNENALVIAQQLRLRLADRFKIRDAHSAGTTCSPVEIAHQFSAPPPGACSFCAAGIASSTVTASSSR